jgi:glyoxylase I family protein
MQMFKSLHHIAIICSDYQRSKHFYVDLLGFKVIREEYRKERDSWKIDLSLNDHYVIELFSFPSPPKRVGYPEAAGLRHLAFEVESIEESVQELNKKGIETEEVRIDPFTQKSFTFFKDPDGLPIELYQS